jgi:hypothetical protein
MFPAHDIDADSEWRTRRQHDTEEDGYRVYDTAIRRSQGRGKTPTPHREMPVQGLKLVAATHLQRAPQPAPSVAALAAFQRRVLAQRLWQIRHKSSR